VLCTDWKIRVYDLMGTPFETISLNNKSIRGYVRSLSIEVREGESKEATIEMKKIHELNQFPPGVLPICASYLGTSILFVTVSRGDTKTIRSYDESGHMIKCIADADMMTIDHLNGLIHTLDTDGNDVASYTYDGVLVDEWVITPRTWNVIVFQMMNRLIYTEYQYTERRRVLYEPHDHKCTHTSTITEEGMDPSTYVIHDKYVINVYSECIKRLNTPFDESNTVEFKTNPAIRVDTIVDSVDGSNQTYAFDALTRTVHVLMFQ
jgi:hypothetical protein